MVISGVFSSNAVDSVGEAIDIASCDISDLKDGDVNWNHLGKAKEDSKELSAGTAINIIGKIIFCKKILKETDCDTEDQLFFWKKINLPYIYGQCKLFEEHSHSQEAQAIVLCQESYDMQMIGFSIEGRSPKSGAKDNGDGTKNLIGTMQQDVALTTKPCNKTCILHVYKEEYGEKLKKSFDFKDLMEMVEKNLDVAPSQISGLNVLQKQEEPLQLHKNKIFYIKTSHHLPEGDLHQTIAAKFYFDGNHFILLEEHVGIFHLLEKLPIDEIEKTLQNMQRYSFFEICEPEYEDEIQKSHDLESALAHLQSMADRGHVDHAAVKTLRRELFQDTLVPEIGNRRSFDLHVANAAPEDIHVAGDGLGFGKINKLYSHAHGDESISHMGKAWHAAAQETSQKFNMAPIKLARGGGDELSAIIPHHENKIEAAHHFVQKVNEHLNKIPAIGASESGQGGHKLAMSMGIGHTRDSADVAMQQGKSSHKTKFGGDSSHKDYQQSHAHSALKGFEGPVGV
jgi:GGDEF domain-containing protein